METSDGLSKNTYYQYVIAASMVIGLVGYMLMKYWSGSSSKTKPNVILLHTVGSTTTIVNPSPFGLKLQTYFRMAGNIPYELDCNSPFGKNGKSPWMEFNGEPVMDSSLIIEYLNERFPVDIDDHLTEKQKALGRLLQKTVEENTFW